MEQNDSLEPTPLSSREEWKYLLHSPSFWGYVIFVICMLLFIMVRPYQSDGDTHDLFAILFAYMASLEFVDYRKGKDEGRKDAAILFGVLGALLSVSHLVLYLLNRLKA